VKRRPALSADWIHGGVEKKKPFPVKGNGFSIG
jgi:hypothetical protein